MKTFHCDSCGNHVFFENVRCLNCGHVLGYLPQAGVLSALEPAGSNWTALARGQQGQSYRQCANARDYEVCNWMIPAEASNNFCVSCSLNELIPDLSINGNLHRWRILEKAKRRLLYTILHLHLPLTGAGERPALRFRFLAATKQGEPVLTGHLNGLITLNIIEADDDEREKRRVSLHEPYRTVLGHLRHEVAHYYWDRLVADSPWLPRFREVFGDESQDYGEALKHHYKNGAPADWQSRHVTAYASSHPWEDWAETWAHYFHIIDMVETAGNFGISLKLDGSTVKIPEKADVKRTDFDELLESWFPLTYALNSINRGMGLLDVYPFVLSPVAVQKLRFIDEVVKAPRND